MKRREFIRTGLGAASLLALRFDFPGLLPTVRRRDLVEHLASGEEFSGGPLVVVAMIVAGLTILWHAWKWPTVQEELDKPPLLAADDIMTPVSAGTASIPR